MHCCKPCPSHDHAQVGACILYLLRARAVLRAWLGGIGGGGGAHLNKPGLTLRSCLLYRWTDHSPTCSSRSMIHRDNQQRSMPSCSPTHAPHPRIKVSQSVSSPQHPSKRCLHGFFSGQNVITAAKCWSEWVKTGHGVKVEGRAGPVHPSNQCTRGRSAGDPAPPPASAHRQQRRGHIAQLAASAPALLSDPAQTHHRMHMHERHG
jgi:hypothetical protein